MYNSGVMKLENIEARLSHIQAMVEGWKSSGRVPSIERDMALEELRRVYDEVLGAELSVEPVVAAKSEPEPEPKAERVAVEPEEIAEKIVEENIEEIEESIEEEIAASVTDAGDSFDDALDIDALLGLTTPESESEPEPEPTPELVVEPEPIAEPTPAPAHKRAGGLFDIEDIPVRSKSGRKMIALYNTPAAMPQREEPKPQRAEAEGVKEAEPARVVEPVKVAEAQPVEAPKRLADVLGSGVTVLGDKMAGDDAPTTPFNRISDLRKAIGLNDKFLMIRDLFGGDAAKFEQTIDALNAFDDLDECMIYIVENFRWNPDLEGAKLLVSLIERKLA